jgi:hypothetical protein
MRALSIRQPWAWCILHAGKDIENRDWQPCNPGLRFRGTFLLHASLRCDPIDQETRERIRAASGIEIPNDPPRGGIVGQVDVVDRRSRIHFALVCGTPWLGARACQTVVVSRLPRPAWFLQTAFLG